MSAKSLVLSPVDMDRENMSRLETMGLIHRIAPGKDVAGPVDGDNLGRSIYESDARFGGHKLIAATIGATYLRYFGFHEDDEDVWLLGLDSWRPLYFVIGTCSAGNFTAKVRGGSLSESDFVCLRARYNDPEASFFVMKKFIPHGEFVVPTNAPPPTFYVTESANLEIVPVSFGSVAVKVRDGNMERGVSCC